MSKLGWIEDDGPGEAYDYGRHYPEDHRLYGICLERIYGTVRKMSSGKWSSYVSAYGDAHFDTKEKAMENTERYVSYLTD